MSYGHTTFVLSTSARSMTIIDKITICCNDVNKISTSFKLLAVNILHYMSQRSNTGLGIKSMDGLKTFVEQCNGHNAFAHSLKFDELLQWSHFVRFCNEYDSTFCADMGKCSSYHPVLKYQFCKKMDIASLCCQTAIHDFTWQFGLVVMRCSWCMKLHYARPS